MRPFEVPFMKRSYNPADRQKIALLAVSFAFFAGFFLFLFFPDAAGANASLFRQISDAVSAPSGAAVLDGAYYAFAAFYLLLVVITVVNIFVEKKAIFVLCCIETLLGIALPAFLLCALVGTGADPAELFSAESGAPFRSTLLMPCFALLAAIALCLLYHKKKGILKAVYALIAAGCAAFFFSDIPFLLLAGEEGSGLTAFRFIQLLCGAPSYSALGRWDAFVCYSFTVLAYAAAVNAALAFLSLAVRRMRIDFIRAAALFGVSLFCFCLLIAEAGAARLGELGGMIGFLAVSAVQVAVAAVCFALRRKGRKTQGSFTDAASVNAAFDEASGILYGAPAQDPFAYEGAIRDESAAAEAEDPAFGYEAKKRSAPDESDAAQEYADSPAAHDPFLDGLTPAERAEFERLFIVRVFGENKQLPPYRPGGDNREFFAKVFVFMGRFRNIISESLLEKIYYYSNAVR